MGKYFFLFGKNFFAADCNGDLEGCTLAEMDALRDWEARFHQKYAVVGRVVPEIESNPT